MNTATHPMVTFLIIPNLEHPEYFQPCIESILAQTFIDIEILVLDTPVSTVHPPIANAIACQKNLILSPILLKEPMDPADYYNYSIQQAKGTLIWMLPVEHCLASPQVVQGMVTQFILNPKLGFAFCRGQHMDAQGNPYESYTPHKKNTDLPYQPTLYPGMVFFRHLLKGNVVPNACAVARKQCYLDTGMFEPELADSAAWYNWLRFSLEWDVFFDPAPKVYVRHAGNLALGREKLSRENLEARYDSYEFLELHLKDHHYPKALQRQVHLAKLQFMRRKGFKMSLLQKVMRFYQTLTAPRFDLSPV